MFAWCLFLGKSQPKMPRATLHIKCSSTRTGGFKNGGLIRFPYRMSHSNTNWKVDATSTVYMQSYWFIRGSLFYQPQLHAHFRFVGKSLKVTIQIKASSLDVPPKKWVPFNDTCLNITMDPSRVNLPALGAINRGQQKHGTTFAISGGRTRCRVPHGPIHGTSERYIYRSMNTIKINHSCTWMVDFYGILM